MRAVVAVFAIAALSGVSSAFAQGAAPSGDPVRGKALFERVGCWSCHGLEGQGGREGPRIAAPVPMTWPALSAFVRSTTGEMPPYTEKALPNQDLADIYAYLQSIPPPPDYRTIPILSQILSSAEP